MDELDLKYNHLAVCPHCGYKNPDSHELPDSGECYCHSCEKEYFVEREIEVTYSTSKIDSHEE